MATSSTAQRRLGPGHVLEPFELQTLSHGLLRVPSGGMLHLQFRRFAGCPICNLHLRTFARKLGQLEAAGVQPVAFFHSSAEEMRKYQGDVPFAVVADLERRWYRRFGVERSVPGMFHPKAAWAAVKGMLSVRSNAFKAEGGHDGLPADFLVDRSGRVLAAHYGAHPDDHWEVEELVALAQAPARAASASTA